MEERSFSPLGIINALCALIQFKYEMNTDQDVGATKAELFKKAVYKQ